MMLDETPQLGVLYSCISVTRVEIAEANWNSSWSGAFRDFRH